jgi:ParB/RepB/Spo0J family partition protein
VVQRPEDGGYDLINGHRRFLAHRRAGIKTIRANTYSYEPDELADEGRRRLAISQFLLAANSAEPLVPIERARYYEALMDKTGMEVADIAKAHHITEEAVTDDLMFLNLDERVLDLAEALPESFTVESLRILAENATPSAKKAWMMTGDEQVQVAEAIALQRDKKLNESARALRTHIKDVVNRRRQEKTAQKRRLGSGGDDPVKSLFRLLDSATKSVGELTKADLSGIKEIDPKDKGAAYQAALGLAQELLDFAEGPVMRLKAKGAGSTTAAA